MTPQALARLLAGWRFPCSPESALQKGIAEALTSLGLTFEREARLGQRDRIDFIVGPAGGPRLGLEVKVQGAFPAVARQIQRYQAHPEVSGLLLVTTRAGHTELPPSLGGKPVAVLHVTPGAL